VVEVPAEKRPRRLPAEGVGSFVRPVGDVTGLTQMGVAVRTIDAGMAGTHRHYHDVEEECVDVLSGTGVVRIGPHRLDLRAGSFVGFPPGPGPHHCVASADDPLVLLEGGERRRLEETVHYPDLGLIWRRPEMTKEEGPLRPEGGDAAQVCHVEEAELREFQHPVDSGARREMRSLHTAVGLERQAVRWSRVSVGDRSTALHTHDRTDEWVYVLAGSARVRVADDEFEVGAGDFLGHPAGGPAHLMNPISDLVYLMGGQIDPEDTVIYPEAGVRLHHGRIEPL
jgi:uncharacterized cupin superfamily protein